MRISDWSSDVCSSDLVAEALTLGSTEEQHSVLGMILNGADVDAEDVRRVLLDGKPSVAAAIFPLTRYSGTLTGDLFAEAEIGRASCRDRVCQYVSISVVAVSLKKNTNNTKSNRLKIINEHTKYT